MIIVIITIINILHICIYYDKVMYRHANRSDANTITLIRMKCHTEARIAEVLYRHSNKDIAIRRKR